VNLVLAIALCLFIGFVYTAGMYWLAWWFDKKVQHLAQSRDYSGDVW